VPLHHHHHAGSSLAITEKVELPNASPHHSWDPPLCHRSAKIEDTKGNNKNNNKL
jgi:hypothetical protein